MDAVLGLIGLALFIAAVIALAAGITLLVIKLSPAKDKKPKSEPEPAS